MEDNGQEVSIAIENTDKHSGGRPTSIGEIAIAKLIGALQQGWSITKACEYAQISIDAYYRRFNSDDKFRNEVTIAKNFWIEHAHQHLTALLTDHNYSTFQDKKLKVELALKILEKQEPEEYGAKPQMSVQLNQLNKNSISDNPTQEQLKQFHSNGGKALFRSVNHLELEMRLRVKEKGQVMSEEDEARLQELLSMMPEYRVIDERLKQMVQEVITPDESSNILEKV